MGLKEKDRDGALSFVPGDEEQSLEVRRAQKALQREETAFKG